MTVYKIGDRVKVKPGKEHDEMTKDKEGTVEEISTEALGVKFDGMEMMHKWYVDDEVQSVNDSAARARSIRSINPKTGQQRSPVQRALRFIAQERWAIVPQSLQLIMDIAARAHQADWEAVLAKQGTALEKGSMTMVRGRTAILPVTGPIFRYANLFTEFSGATSIAMLAKEFRSAVDSPAVDHIILEINSPGGMVTGTSEFAQMVRTSRKPVIAYVDGMAASAAYWIASATGSIVMNDTAQVGSIGVVSTVWTDDDDNVIEIVSTQSPGKRPNVRSDEGRAQIQKDTDELAQVFVETVAANRKVSVETVLSDFGRGGVLIGKSAVAAGMADRLGSMEELIEQLNRK